MHILVLLKFTPLEFETVKRSRNCSVRTQLKFTPLEFETKGFWGLECFCRCLLKFTPLEFETQFTETFSIIVDG